MQLETYPAASGGICDCCHEPYEAGEFIAQHGEDIFCPFCVVDHLELGAI